MKEIHEIKIGIIGGGQLGKMILSESNRMNLKTLVLDSNENSPCKNLCDNFYLGNLDNYNDIIEFVSQSQKIMPHFHIPLQSGSDKILKLMKRRYLSELYVDRVNKIKELIPDCCIGADVIVGFPGENDIDFKRTYDFISSLEFSYLHVFSYSERENTESVYFAEKNSKKIKSERSLILRELSNIKRESFYKKNINSERKILFESENKNGFVHGYTDNYIRVKTIWSSNLVDSIVTRKLSAMSNDSLVVV